MQKRFSHAISCTCWNYPDWHFYGLLPICPLKNSIYYLHEDAVTAHADNAVVVGEVEGGRHLPGMPLVLGHLQRDAHIRGFKQRSDFRVVDLLGAFLAAEGVDEDEQSLGPAEGVEAACEPLAPRHGGALAVRHLEHEVPPGPLPGALRSRSGGRTRTRRRPRRARRQEGPDDDLLPPHLDPENLALQRQRPLRAASSAAPPQLPVAQRGFCRRAVHADIGRGAVLHTERRGVAGMAKVLAPDGTVSREWRARRQEASGVDDEHGLTGRTMRSMWSSGGEA